MDKNWAFRHREAHEAFLKGKPTKLEDHISRRFAMEFEAALKERGQNAKEASKRRSR